MDSCLFRFGLKRTPPPGRRLPCACFTKFPEPCAAQISESLPRDVVGPARRFLRAARPQTCPNNFE
eukprot:10392704-Lingulodinium_polyedra.AAC.1